MIEILRSTHLAMLNQILIIENDLYQRQKCSQLLKEKGYMITEADSIKSARFIFKNHIIAVVVLEINLLGGGGVEFVKEIKHHNPDIQIVILTENSFIDNAVQAIKYGAFDYVLKGDDLGRHIELIEQAMKIAIDKFQDRLRFADVAKLEGFNAIIGKSNLIERVRFLGDKVAKTNTTVLLMGETGVGKDIMAEAIHTCSPRSKHPFVAINCSAIGQEMLESELFGYKAGAFTGAVKDKKGLFEEGDKGTIFLDEIGDMNLILQAKILRVLENKNFIKMGDTKTSKSDCRIIAATHVNLLEAVKNGKFREDLYYRISSFMINIPPLRDRMGDVAELTDYFVRKISARLKVPVPEITNSFMQYLLEYSWPGNVRELINVLEKAIILSSGPLTSDLLDYARNTTHSSNNLQVMELKHINDVLSECEGNKRKAARRLGISIATLYRKIGFDN